jgi:hypothetical protein
MSNTLTKLRYRYWPDHVFGELLQKQWMETAVPLLVLLLTIAFFSSRIDNFISVANLSDTLRQASELGFVVLGMSLVLIVGGIDLSVASIFALCNLTALYCINVLGLPTPAVIALTLLLGAVLGAVNGVLIGYMRMRAFLTTMVTLIVYKAIHDLLNFQLAVAISSVVPRRSGLGLPRQWRLPVRPDRGLGVRRRRDRQSHLPYPPASGLVCDGHRRQPPLGLQYRSPGKSRRGHVLHGFRRVRRDLGHLLCLTPRQSRRRYRQGP